MEFYCFKCKRRAPDKEVIVNGEKIGRAIHALCNGEVKLVWKVKIIKLELYQVFISIIAFLVAMMCISLYQISNMITTANSAVNILISLLIGIIIGVLLFMFLTIVVLFDELNYRTKLRSEGKDGK